MCYFLRSYPKLASRKDILPRHGICHCFTAGAFLAVKQSPGLAGGRLHSQSLVRSDIVSVIANRRRPSGGEAIS